MSGPWVRIPPSPPKRKIMITIFNRKELIITPSLEAFTKAKTILAQNGIDYTWKVLDLTAHNWGHSTQIGIDQNFSKLYYIYVRKKDYEEAYYQTKIRKEML